MVAPFFIAAGVRAAAGSIAGGGGSNQGVSINIATNYKQLEKRLNNIQRKQLPFAFANTLNDVAFKVRKQIVDRTFPRSFDVRDKKFASASFRVKKANKRKLESVVFDKLDRGNLKLHAKGGTRRGRSGSIAVPTNYVKGKRKTRGVPAASRPKRVIESANGYLSDKAGKKMIWQEYGRKGSKKRLMYSLKPTVRIKKRFYFYEDANKTVDRTIQGSFDTNFRKALASARR